MTYTNEQKKLIKDQLTPANCEDIYDDMLDDCYGDVKIAGLDYSASVAQFRVDPTAYRCGVSDYIDGLISDEILTDEIDGYHYYQSEVNDILENNT